mgnify:CR=1 FL=1
MMLTRCPTCSTAFRVTSEQLKARAGKVRCGHCSAVFNALETLEDAPPAAEAAGASVSPEPVTPTPVEPPLPEPSPESSPTGQSATEPPDESVSTDILPEGISSEIEPPAPRWRLLAWSLAGLAATAAVSRRRKWSSRWAIFHSWARPRKR